MTFAGRQDLKLKEGSPGPGAYSHASDKAVGGNRSAGFGTAPRELNRTAPAPGPGQYSPPPRVTGKSGFGFGSSPRKTGSNSTLLAPGPGQYAHSPKLGVDGPKFSAMPRRSGIKTAEGPGPGSYGTLPGGAPSSPTSSKGFGFGTSPREGKDRRVAADGPGPGQYNSHEQGGKKGPGYSMSTRRDGVKGVMDTPGPGAYGGAQVAFGKR